jgi:glycosyltransferase involved in cell wall biosynthesis
MKVLVSAYACEPGKGSEPEVGLEVVLAAARHHEVWVITRDNNLAPLRRYLADHPLRDRIHLHGVDLPGLAMRAKRWGIAGMQWYYDRWQQRALDAARQLDRLVGFDVVHHATFASYWARTGLAELDKPLVWGPVGGAVEVPRGWWGTLGVSGAGEEALRLVTRRLLAARPVVRRTIRRATVVIAQNGETAARLGRARPGPITVLPNASAVGPVALEDPPHIRGRDVVCAGRLVPWKAVPLAIAAMRHVTHPDSRLRVFGAGPDAARSAAAASRAGLSDRVELCGHVPREELLRAVAGAGVLLHPALHEEAGLVVAEALSLNTPVVALRRGGPAELVARYTESPAQVVEVGDPDETARNLGAAIDRFLRSPPPTNVARRPTPAFDEAMLQAYAAAVGTSPP